MATRTTTSGEITFDQAAPARSLWSDALRRLMRNKMAVASIVVILFFIAVAVSAPLIAPHDPTFQSRIRNGGGVELPPMWAADGKPGYLLGTDVSGRDVLSRIMYGAQVSLSVGFIPMFIILIIGTIVGMNAGFRGGWVDSLLMRVTDITYAFPDLLFLLIVISALRDTPIASFLGGLPLMFIALSLIGWVGVARLVRGQVLSLREKEFVEAARSIGTSNGQIMMRHLLPNSLAPLIVSAAFGVPGFILAESFLSYIGIGVRPPMATWGGIISDGFASINSSPHLVWVPATCIGLLTLSFTFLGDGLRDALDPRMKL